MGQLEWDLRGHLCVLTFPGTHFAPEGNLVENEASVKSEHGHFWGGKVSDFPERKDENEVGRMVPRKGRT